MEVVGGTRRLYTGEVPGLIDVLVAMIYSLVVSMWDSCEYLGGGGESHRWRLTDVYKPPCHPHLCSL